MLSKSLFLSLIVSLFTSAYARTWTSTDGRTIEASLVSSSENSVVLRLDATGATVTVTKSKLSATDLAFIEKTTINDKDIILLIGRYPTLTTAGDASKQLNEKYAGFVKIMTPATAFNICQLMRKKLSDDIKYWKSEAERPSAQPKPLTSLKPGADPMTGVRDMDAKRAKLKEQKQTDKDNYKWVSETLPAWIAEVEKAASQ